MQTLKKTFLSILLALVLGVGTAWFFTGTGYRLINGSAQIACWTYEPLAGSIASNPYTKAYIARTAIYALNKSETVYPIASVDSDGNLLDPSKTYQIEGKTLDTRWWSITAYLNNYLIPNESGIYSFSQTTIQLNPDNGWVIKASPKKQNLNWLPLGNKKGKLEFVLRCYNPSESFIKSLENGTVQLPSIKQIP